MSDILLHVAGIVLQAVTAGGVAYMIVRKTAKKVDPRTAKRNTQSKQLSPPVVTVTPVKSKTVYLHDQHDDKLITAAKRQAGVDDEW